MSFRKEIIVGGFSVILVLGGCAKWDSPINPENSGNNTSSQPEQFVLGKKLENPYSVSSMMRARDSLESQGVLSKKKLPDEYFQPTHLYIRYKPKTIEEYLEINQKSGLVLWDFPLDYQFPVGMIKYRDPEIPEGRPNYLYTAVKVNQKLAFNSYEVLAKLILAPEPEDISLAKKDALFGYYSVLEHEALRITGNLSDAV